MVGGLDGDDFGVRLSAGFVAADAGDPDLSFAEHGAFVADEESVVLLVLDDAGYGGGDDVLVVFDEGLGCGDGEGFGAGVDLDGVGDERGYGGGVVTGDGLLEVGDELLDVGVVGDEGVDALVYFGGGVLGEGEGG